MATTLSERILSLCDPTPAAFKESTHDWSDEDDTKAKLCTYTEENSPSDCEELHHRMKSYKKSSLRRDTFETDSRYEGKPVSSSKLRKQWEISDITQEETDSETLSEEGAEFEDDLEEEELESNDLDEDRLEEDDSEGEGLEEDDSEGEELQEDDSEGEGLQDEVTNPDEIGALSSTEFVDGSGGGVHNKGDQYEDVDVLFNMDDNDITAGLRESMAEDIEKGRAVKHQLSIWDGLLETRIRIQKILPLINRLPQGEMMGVFKDHGRDTVNDRLQHSYSELSTLLNNLLELQKTLLSQNPSTRHIIDGKSAANDCGISGNHDDSLDDVDEEISSEFSDEETEDLNQATPTIKTTPTSHRPKRCNRTHSEWDGQYDKYIERIHQSFTPYRNETITKWNEKLKLASGKMTSKAFLQFDRSIMTHIDYVLKDKQRLRKRTQLKRSSGSVIGCDIAHGTAAKKMALQDEEQPMATGDKVKEYDEEIFDDSDFYHQLLKELIERKTSSQNTNDPIEMGRQWLELQKLRVKVKKKVDTKASKGRKLRYEIHPKLSNFMTPIDKGTMNNTSRNDLFSSLFGSRSAQTL